MSGLELKRFGLFADLGEEDREYLLELLETRDLANGQPAFQEGQEADGLVLVERGALRIESRRVGPLGALGPGASLGALSLLAVGPREVTAIAEGATRIRLLSRSAFRRMAEDAPRGTLRLLERVLVDLAQATRSQLDTFAESDDV